MKSPLLFFSLFTLLFFFSVGCKKQTPNDFHLHIVEYGTGRPISNAGVQVFHFSGGFFIGGTYTLLDSLVTNSNGNIYIKDYDKRVIEVRIFTREKNHFDRRMGFSYGTIKIDSRSKNETFIELYPIAYLRLHVNWEDFDSLYNSIRIHGISSLEISSDTILEAFLVRGNFSDSLSISGGRSGWQTDWWHQPFYVAAFDTMDVIIKPK